MPCALTRTCSRDCRMPFLAPRHAVRAGLAEPKLVPSLSASWKHVDAPFYHCATAPPASYAHMQVLTEPELVQRSEAFEQAIRGGDREALAAFCSSREQQASPKTLNKLACVRVFTECRGCVCCQLRRP